MVARLVGTGRAPVFVHLNRETDSVGPSLAVGAAVGCTSPGSAQPPLLSGLPGGWSALDPTGATSAGLVAARDLWHSLRAAVD